MERHHAADLMGAAKSARRSRRPLSKRRLLKAMTLAASALASACASAPPVNAPGSSGRLGAADLIIYGGTIYTGVEADPTTDAVAVENGVIVSTGIRELLLASASPNATIIDLEGAAMYPGFTDAHAHLLGIGLRELDLNLETVQSIAELVERVAASVQHTGENETVIGRGWIETHWPEKRMPTRDDIDPVSGENPVILSRADGHAALVNSAALAAAGIDDATKDPAGGRIERDATGRATGILIDNAMSLVAGLAGALSEDKKRAAFEKASAVYAAYGWTGIHNMSVDLGNVPLMESLSVAGNDNGRAPALAIRVYNAVDEGHIDDLISGGARVSENERITTRAVKVYLDGALGSRGALLAAPYADAPETSGLALMEEIRAKALFERAIAADIQIAAHAIGDKANARALKWFGETFASHPDADDVRWRIEHAQIVAPKDIALFEKHSVIASMQPSHAIGDLFFAPARLGASRLDGAYAWRSMLDAGVLVAGGSDAPVERGDPLIEFYAAVARRGLDGTQTEEWRPGEAVSRQQALAMFTSAPAYASFQEDTLGTIEPGKRADFSVFSKDIMTAPEEEILKAKAIMTIVDGAIVYRAPE